MLKIKNVSKVKGITVNGCRILDIEYSSDISGYIFTLEDTHELSTKGTGLFCIHLVDGYIPNEINFFIMGWKLSTEINLVKDNIINASEFVNCMYELIERGKRIKAAYNV